jgi:hypothetical protein
MSETAGVPGSGALSQRERELTARVHTVVTVATDTMVAKVLRPGDLERYLRHEVSAGRWDTAPPFDHHLAGGTVARLRDLAGLRTPGDFVRALRLDYPGSPFQADLPVVHVLEFPATEPAQFVTPFGAPTLPYPRVGFPPNMTEVRVVAAQMADAAEASGVDPNTYRIELNPWPFSGTGITADPRLGVPEWWHRYAPLPAGAAIVAVDPTGQRRPVARYLGVPRSWEALA